MLWGDHASRFQSEAKFVCLQSAPPINFRSVICGRVCSQLRAARSCSLDRTRLHEFVFTSYLSSPQFSFPYRCAYRFWSGTLSPISSYFKYNYTYLIIWISKSSSFLLCIWRLTMYNMRAHRFWTPCFEWSPRFCWVFLASGDFSLRELCVQWHPLCASPCMWKKTLYLLGKKMPESGAYLFIYLFIFKLWVESLQCRIQLISPSVLQNRWQSFFNFYLPPSPLPSFSPRFFCYNFACFRANPWCSFFF